MELIVVMTLILPMLHRLKRKRRRSITQRMRMPALLRSSKLWKIFVRDLQEEALLGKLHQYGNQRQRRRRSQKTRYLERKIVVLSLEKRNPKRAPFMSVAAF